MYFKAARCLTKGLDNDNNDAIMAKSISIGRLHLFPKRLGT